MVDVTSAIAGVKPPRVENIPNGQLTSYARRRMLAGARRNEMRETFLRRGRVDNQAAWAEKIAEIVAVQHPAEIDFVRFEGERTKIGCPIDEAAAMAAIHQISEIAERKGFAFKLSHPTAAGRALKITTEEKIELGLRLLNDDVPLEERKARRLRAKRIRERERRAARGSVTRQEYLAKALSRSRPWEAQGVSRRTWERRRKSVAHNTESIVVTRTCDTAHPQPRSAFGGSKDGSLRSRATLLQADAGGGNILGSLRSPVSNILAEASLTSLANGRNAVEIITALHRQHHEIVRRALAGRQVEILRTAA